MRVLAINCGSSSLKFDLVHMTGGGTDTDLSKVAGGVVERIGKRSSMTARNGNGEHRRDVSASDHATAIGLALTWLRDAGHLPAGVDAVAHRVVHGGDRFLEPAVIDDAVLAGILSVSLLAPLHNEPALAGIEAAKVALRATLPQVAVFDTAFHRTLPPRAATYALPLDLVDRHGLRRFGFHGIAHSALAHRRAKLAGRPLDDSRLITQQLGNGASAAAVADGRSTPPWDSHHSKAS